MAWSIQQRLRYTATMTERYGEDFQRVISVKGGSARVPKGFALNRALARRVGKVGGSRTKPR